MEQKDALAEQMDYDVLKQVENAMDRSVSIHTGNIINDTFRFIYYRLLQHHLHYV